LKVKARPEENPVIRKNRNIIKRSREICHGKRGEGPVIYWMDRDHRIADNWALLYAQQEALLRGKDLHVVLLYSKNMVEHSCQQPFLLEGLVELREEAKRYNIGFTVLDGEAEDILPRFLVRYDCHLLVTDFSPLREKRRICRKFTEVITVPFVEVDAHNIIPAWVVTTKKEYAAYTLRPKVNRLLSDYLTDFIEVARHPSKPGLDTADFPDITNQLDSMLQVFTCGFPAGERQALSGVREFLASGLDRYEQERNNPNLNGQSGLSPYLHFGHLAPQRLAWEVEKAEALQASKECFLEELIVRRELSDNFCLYEASYDSFEGFPDWARKSLNLHRGDKREFIYDLNQLENAETHEELWNSCQRDLLTSHKLHGYLRMYWAKKILEWTTGPEEALYNTIYLNDKYSLDGCDPNGYAGIAWSIGGVHDRAWPEREVFGKIRYMNERGCRRKFEVDRYIAEISLGK